ncbi:MAG: hypothetical protein V5A43_03470 [Haloarculaceae archaeon]
MNARSGRGRAVTYKSIPGLGCGMPEAERVWLVERSYSDKGLVTLVYATPDGEHAVTKQRSEQMLARTDVTAAEDVDPGSLERVDEAAVVERYASEANRMRDSHAPEDPV